MGWASAYIERLKAGETVQFRPRGNSMTPLIESGQLVTVEPFDGNVGPGDIVLCRVKSAEYLHLVKAIAAGRYLIGNNHGRINGWTPARNIFGVVTEIK